ncbi:MAG: TlpA family protein disulfide reductase [Bacteroidales bacterium]
MAKPVGIQGYFPLASGETVFVLRYSDYISLNEEVVAHTTIGPDGYFFVELSLEHPAPLLIEIAFHRVSLYAIPGKSYKVRSEEFQVQENANPLRPESIIPCAIHGPETDSLLRALDASIAALLDTAAYEIYLKQNVAPLESLTLKASENPDPMYRSCAAYYLATLYPGARLPLGLSSFNEIKPDYYSWYFFTWLDDYLSKSLTRDNPLAARSDFTRNLVQVVNKEENLSKFKERIQQHFNLRDSTLTDYVTLAALKVLYRTPVYQNTAVLSLIRQFAAQAASPPLARIADNLIQRFTWLAPSTLLPSFTTRTMSGDTLQAAQLKGRPIYLVFARQYCNSCLNSLELLRPLYDRFKGKWEIIAFFTSHDTASEAAFVRKMQYPWPVVIAGRDYDLQRTFRAYSLPLEALVNDKGEIVAWPAYRPGEGLEALLEKMLNPGVSPRKNSPVIPPRKY